MSSDADKTARLASALRANLARRKAQGRARQAAERAQDASAPDAARGEPGQGAPAATSDLQSASLGISEAPAIEPGGGEGAPSPEGTAPAAHSLAAKPQV